MFVQIICPHCEQHIEAPEEVIGSIVACPTCTESFRVGTKPSIAPPSPERPPTKSNSPLGAVRRLICACSGLPSLENFHLTNFLSNPFKQRPQTELDSYFNCGCPLTTPSLTQVDTEWPQPWFFLRLLLFGSLVLLAFIIGFQGFGNEKMIPGVIIIGGFLVPLVCVTLFFELNVLRNISLYQVIKFIIWGGAVSLVISLFLYDITGLGETFLGATSAGIVEETAKLLAAVILLRGAQQYKWTLNGLLVGAAVGAGFAGFESAGYIFNAYFRDLEAQDAGFTQLYGALFIRALFAPFCHVVWTASVVGALWRVKKDQPFRLSMLFKKNFLRVLAFVVALHMLWNSGLLQMSPRNVGFLRAELYLWLTSIVGSWYLALLLVQDGLKQVKVAVVSAGDSIHEGAYWISPEAEACEEKANEKSVSKPSTEGVAEFIPVPVAQGGCDAASKSQNDNPDNTSENRNRTDQSDAAIARVIKQWIIPLFIVLLLLRIVFIVANQQPRPAGDDHSTLSSHETADEQYQRAMRYESGDSANRNYEEAVKLFRSAAEQGHAAAQAHLADLYANGLGVEKNESEAFKWNQKSAYQGYAAGQCHLGWCFDKGFGVTQDLEEAAKWYRKAAEQGNLEAEYNLGTAYERGIGGYGKNIMSAKLWYHLAAEQGYTDAVAAYERLKDR